MNKAEYFKFAEQFFAKCLEISKAKNADYTGGAEDPFSNFKAVEVLGISTEQGFLTRMMDKMKRIASFAEKGELQVKDESVTDTLRDLANYACLLAGYIESQKTAGPAFRMKVEMSDEMAAALKSGQAGHIEGGKVQSWANADGSHTTMVEGDLDIKLKERPAPILQLRQPCKAYKCPHYNGNLECTTVSEYYKSCPVKLL